MVIFGMAYGFRMLWVYDDHRNHGPMSMMSRVLTESDEIDHDALTLEYWSNVAIFVLHLCRPPIGYFEMMPTDHVSLARLVKPLPIAFIVPVVFSISSFGHSKSSSLKNP